ncbi:MAG: UDP-N-acetylglucosamine 2-epimerase (non-hydrolyzing), partial [Ignavibacteria bacterium]|nr:UDP-N-acetylglucosamine 2-epimerase (non-hydrolyzing) [Ignavibacteria bacterium]
TGQHYDYKMNELFFKQLNIREPDVYLGIGSGLQGEQTGKIMISLEKEVMKIKPQLIVVVGDVNSTLAASLVASKLGIKLAHVEAGHRSGDMSMPEEINRIVTDRLSDYLFTISKDCNDNLIKEGIPKSKIFFTGNVMIDTLMKFKRKSLQLKAYRKFGLKRKKFALLTLHRPSNVDSHENLRKILLAMKDISNSVPVIFPSHPRTQKNIDTFAMRKIFDKGSFIITDPLGYLESISLIEGAMFVVTDSGGIQAESTVLKTPCITVRETTEHPVTITRGTNHLVGLDMNKLLRTAEKITEGNYKKGKIPEYWDGKASQRIAGIIKKLFL